MVLSKCSKLALIFCSVPRPRQTHCQGPHKRLMTSIATTSAGRIVSFPCGK